MVIENAERFGLAQLRGRIGSGAEASTCLLLYHEPLGEMSKARLKVIRETTDGLRIAEEDLKLRGEGDVLGIRQGGPPGYRIARSEVHAQLTPARSEALPALLVRARRGYTADRRGLKALTPSLRAKRSNPLPRQDSGLLRRGACHRARIRATRWLLAMIM
jgi:RecG-like helicase